MQFPKCEHFTHYSMRTVKAFGRCMATIKRFPFSYNPLRAGLSEDGSVLYHLKGLCHKTNIFLKAYNNKDVLCMC